MNFKLFAIGCAVVGVLLLLALARSWLDSPSHAENAYAAKPLLTANEHEFYGRLSRALPDYLIFPQVAMSALIEPRMKFGKANLADFRRISQQRADFTICRQDLSVVCVIELDDRSHDRKGGRARDAQRDARLASAGLACLRFETDYKPSEAEIAHAISAVAEQTVAT